MTDAPVPSQASIRYRIGQDEEFREYPGSDNEHEGELRSLLLGSLQLQHLLVLAGSGTSYASGGPKMWELWLRASKLDGFEPVSRAIRYPPQPDEGNIEVLLSRCDAFLELHPDDEDVKSFRDRAIAMVLEECRAAGRDETTLSPHKEFLRRLSRRRPRDPRLKLFTTNYDRCFEVAAGSLGLIAMDGFSLSWPRRFDPRLFEYDIVQRRQGAESPTLVPGVFQYLKLHGSVDWASRRGRVELDPDVGADEACLIYPARNKFQRSYEQPHLELMAQYLAALREQNTCLLVLGFGFNDDHLSTPILAALENNPHFRVVIVDPAAGERLHNRDGQWARLGDLAKSTDVTFVEATFAQFAGLIPDLHALSPAQNLVRAVQAVAKQ